MTMKRAWMTATRPGADDVKDLGVAIKPGVVGRHVVHRVSA